MNNVTLISGETKMSRQEEMLEKWQGEVFTCVIGAKKDEGGTRGSVVKVGGEKTLPFLDKEGSLPNTAAVALEIFDVPPADWPEELVAAYGGVTADPLEWADACVRKFGAELLCVKLAGAHPDAGGRSPEQEAAFLSKLAAAVNVPLIVRGCGDDVKDNTLLPLCSEALKGERCLFGSASQDNYKTLTAAVTADGHGIIAESPIDLNIAKQLNILISDLGLPLERIVMDPTIGALGYGLEYAYSIMERARLAALSGDRNVACPFICFTGQETWKVKEAVAARADFPHWGDKEKRGILWEAVTASALLQAGADILVMRHPKAAEEIKKYACHR